MRSPPDHRRHRRPRKNADCDGILDDDMKNRGGRQADVGVYASVCVCVVCVSGWVAQYVGGLWQGRERPLQHGSRWPAMKEGPDCDFVVS